MNQNILARAAIAALAALALGPANAAAVHFDFAVTIDTAGLLQGKSFNGSFEFADQAGSPYAFGGTQFTLTGFSFLFERGAPFNGADAPAFGLADLNGSALAIVADGKLAGLDAIGATTPFGFTPAIGPTPASFAFDFGQGNAGFGTIEFRSTAVPGTTVPVPATWALMAGVLPVVAARRAVRRKHAKRGASAA